MKKMLRRAAHFLAYRLYVRPATRRVDRVTMFGLSLRVPPTVFHPAFYLTSRFLGAYLQELDLRGKALLDLGCGSGILGCIAARQGANVTASDINPEAAAAARLNAGANHLAGSLRAVQGDLFDGTAEGERFDVIVWNPPFFPSEPTDDASRAWNAGKGFAVISRFAGEAGEHLCPGGKVILVLSSDTDAAAIRALFTGRGFTENLVRSRRTFFETLSIVELSKEAER